MTARTDPPAEGPWDIVFLITGRPLPAMLDMAFQAQRAGRAAAVILLERGRDDLAIDRALVTFPLITLRVPYKVLDLRRITSLPGIFRSLRRLVHDRLRPDGIVVTASYDLLLLGRLIAVGRGYRLRHQVRDLHRLQLSRAPLARLLRAFEAMLLRRVEKVLVSSPAFATRYYEQIYDGRIVLLENTPARATWQGFRRRPPSDGWFRVGFIGILRYKRSLRGLVAAVNALNDDGQRIKVVFAGGGDASDLGDVTAQPERFAFLGPYEYTRDITRLYAGIDLVYAVYDSDDLNCQVALPNKFYESILSGIPILVADRTFVATEVARLGIGAAVPTGDVPALRSLLQTAARREGWYARALERLDACDPSSYFDAYDRAMRESILP